MKLARALDPVSLMIATDCGAVFYLSQRYGEAYQELSKVLEMEPGFSEALMFRGAALLRQNQYERAIADFQNASRIDNRPCRLGVLGWALGVADKRSEATAVLHKLQAISRHTTVPPWSFAIIYIGLGQTDQAFAWLEKAYAEHSSDLRALKVDPVYDPLRSNPPFQDLVRRVGLAVRDLIRQSYKLDAEPWARAKGVAEKIEQDAVLALLWKHRRSTTCLPPPKFGKVLLKAGAKLREPRLIFSSVCQSRAGRWHSCFSRAAKRSESRHRRRR